MTVAEGGGKRAVQKKFQDIYVPALKANFLVWPAVQMINFRVMPIQLQIVRLSSSSIRYMRYTNLRSLLCPPSVSPGPRTFHSPTPLKRRKYLCSISL